MPTETPDAPPQQGELSTLDEQTEREATVLRHQMSGGEDIRNNAPIVWGSIRVFSVYGKWSFWRKPKPKRT
jgi:hypothetical protein